MNSFRYTPATSAGWLAIARDGRLLTVRAQPTAAERWWTVLGEASGLQGVLDELVREGISTAPSFVLLEWTGEQLHTIVRGEVSLSVAASTGPSEIDGTGISTWVEQHLTGVTAFELGAASGTPLPFESGVVVAGWIGSGTPAAAPASPDDPLHDGETVLQSDVARRRSRRVAPPPPPAGPTLSLRTASGASESLATPLIVGRAPSASQLSGGAIPRLLTITGSDHDISRNHVLFAVQGDTLVVTDMHSRNGTQVRLPGRPSLTLRPGEATPVIAGSVVDLGGGVTFTVEQS